LKVCVVVPAYNEEKRIAKTLEDFRKTIIKRYGNSITVLVVSDGSTDRTNKIVNGFSKKQSQIKLMVNEHSGKGGALRAGFHRAIDERKYDVIGFADADPSVSGTEIMKLLLALDQSGADGIIASRYLKGSRIIGNLTATRYIASRCYNLMVNLLFGLGFKDTQCGAKFFRERALRKIIEGVHLTDMSFDINLLYEMHRHGFVVKEIPITYRIVNESSSVRVGKQIPKMFIITLSYRITKSPLKALFPESFRIRVYNALKNW
jgi:glycosyltransferase involved in cell wall biosynthesis